nr:187-kDa microtubule-associated protein AIR9-like [Ipomoea batatas]
MLGDKKSLKENDALEEGDVSGGNRPKKDELKSDFCDCSVVVFWLLKFNCSGCELQQNKTTKALGQLVANTTLYKRFNLLGNPIQSNKAMNQLRKTASTKAGGSRSSLQEGANESEPRGGFFDANAHEEQPLVFHKNKHRSKTPNPPSLNRSGLLMLASSSR